MFLRFDFSILRLRFHGAAIEDRKRRLAGLLCLPHHGIALNETYREDGAIIFKHACALGCEGIMSKRLGSPYRVGRSAYWLKVKNPAAPAVKREGEWIGAADDGGQDEDERRFEPLDCLE
jgi:ATP-dependent DNA ligase